MKREWIVTMVVATLSAVSLIYVGTLALCALRGIAPPEAVYTGLKEIALVALGSLSSLLVQTRSEPSGPTETKIVNKPSQPIPTTDTDVPH